MGCKNMKNNLSKKPAFALIYALFYVILMSITITSIATLGFSESKRLSWSEASSRAYILAQSGIEEGLAKTLKGGSDSQYNFRYCVADESYKNFEVACNDGTQGFYDVKKSNDGGPIKKIYSTGTSKEGNNSFSVTLLGTYRPGNGKLEFKMWQVGGMP
jgi:hypothetical protein